MGATVSWCDLPPCSFLQAFGMLEPDERPDNRQKSKAETVLSTMNISKHCGTSVDTQAKSKRRHHDQKAV